MEVDPSRCKKKAVTELSLSERETLSNWVERFSMKYEVVGYLNDGSSPKTLAGSMGGGHGSSVTDSEKKSI